jgi:sugar phosphate isomerase/epimerase
LSDVNIGSLHEPMWAAAMEEIRSTISWCRKLDIPLMTLHPGFVRGVAFLDSSLAVERTHRALLSLDKFAKDNSVAVAVENMPANVSGTCTTPEELLRVLEGTGLGICFDIGHANTTRNVDSYLTLADRFINVHIHNNDGQWDQHNVIDDGSADISRVVAALKRTYRGNIVIESTDLETGIISKGRLEALLR